MAFSLPKGYPRVKEIAQGTCSTLSALPSCHLPPWVCAHHVSYPSDKALFTHGLVWGSALRGAHLSWVIDKLKHDEIFQQVICQCLALLKAAGETLRSRSSLDGDVPEQASTSVL